MGSFGQVNFEEQRKALAEPLAVTPWCSVDCKLGCVAVNLELAQVFGCEVYASDGGFATGPDFEEQKLNVGLRVCRSLFRSACVPRVSLCVAEGLLSPLSARVVAALSARTRYWPYLPHLPAQVRRGSSTR